MLKIWFATTLLLKLLIWGVMWVGIYVAVRALLDGEVVFGLLILVFGIPIALFVARVILALSQMVVLLPLSVLLRRRREFTEFGRFQLAVVEMLGVDRVTIRGGWRLMQEFTSLPPREPCAPARSGSELLALLEEVWEEKELKAAYATMHDEPATEPPSPAVG